MKIEKADLRTERTVHDYPEAREMILRETHKAIASARENRSLAAGVRSALAARFTIALGMPENADRSRALDALGREARRTLAHVR